MNKTDRREAAYRCNFTKPTCRKKPDRKPNQFLGGRFRNIAGDTGNKFE
jgi:hypothetical protein